MKRRSNVRWVMSGAAAATISLLALHARAHVVVMPETAPAGRPMTITFLVPEGCAGSATTALRIEIPPNVTLAKPQRRSHKLDQWYVRTMRLASIARQPPPQAAVLGYVSNARSHWRANCSACGASAATAIRSPNTKNAGATAYQLFSQTSNHRGYQRRRGLPRLQTAHSDSHEPATGAVPNACLEDRRRLHPQ